MHHLPPLPPVMWEEVVGASLWISLDLQWIWVDFFHVDLHLCFHHLQGITGPVSCSTIPSTFVF